MIKKIILFGGSGFVGNAVHRQLESNHSLNVTNCDLIINQADNSNAIQANILNLKLVKNIIKDHDLIINFTGQITNPIFNCLQLNTTGIMNICKAVKKYNKKLIQISTVNVYGTTEYADESTILNPETPYSTLKAVSEKIIENMIPESNYAILRLSNLFGKGQPKGIFNYIMKSLQNDRKLHFNNDGSLFRHYHCLDDFVEEIEKIVSLNDFTGIYNIKGEDSYSIKDLVSIFEEVFGIKFKVTYNANQGKENINQLSDIKIRSKISNHLKVSLREFLKNI